MSRKTNRNTKGLQMYAEKRKTEAEDKANKAIDELKRKHKTINFKTVAEASGVSKATLYKNATLRARIESLRAVKQSKPSSKEEERKRRSQEQDLRKQILLLKQEKDLLIAQLVEMDKLKQENQHLKKVLASKRQ